MLLSAIFIEIHNRPENVEIWAIAGICAGIYLFYRGFKLLARKRLIQNTPTSKIRSASVGLVEFNGLAEGPRTIKAPITSLNCFFYRSMAWEWRQSGKNSHWEKVVDESLHVPFYLNDNTGRILIEPEGAEMDIHRDLHAEYSNSIFSSKEVPGNINAFLSRHGIDPTKKFKVEEYCIKPKNALFVLGTLAPNPGLQTPSTSELDNFFPANTPTLNAQNSHVGANYSSAPAARTMLVRNENTGTQEVIRLSGNSKPATTAGMTQQGKIAAAMMKAGIANPAAWEVAGVPYPEAPISEDLPQAASASNSTPTIAASDFDAEPATVLMKGEHNPAFFISWRSQREIARALGWKSTLMIWGGPALTLVSAYVLAMMMGWL